MHYFSTCPKPQSSRPLNIKQYVRNGSGPQDIVGDRAWHWVIYSWIDMNAWVAIAKIIWGPIGPSPTNHGQMLGRCWGNRSTSFNAGVSAPRIAFCIPTIAPYDWLFVYSKSRKGDSLNMFEAITSLIHLKRSSEALENSGQTPAGHHEIYSSWTYRHTLHWNPTKGLHKNLPSLTNRASTSLPHGCSYALRGISI